MATKEYFPGIGKIKFEGKESMNPMAYRYYDAEKVIMGKKMKDWLKFAMAWWFANPQTAPSICSFSLGALPSALPSYRPQCTRK